MSSPAEIVYALPPGFSISSSESSPATASSALSSLGFRRLPPSLPREPKSTMSSPAEILDGLPPGFRFRPLDDELVGLYLLPRVRGQPDLFPGLIVDDDSAANTQPWELFDRHGRSHAVPAFFFVRTNNGGARPDRRCHGGGTWKSMKCERDDASHEMVLDDGEKIKWKRHNLNLHMVTGKDGGGSSGWVMHEYSITTHPSIKICQISLSGFGKNRKRVADSPAGEPESQRPRVDAASSDSYCTTTTSSSQETEHVLGTAMEQGQLQEETEGVTAGVMEQLDVQDCHGASVAAATSALGTPTFHQVGVVHDSAHQDCSDEFIAQMVQEMTDPVPMMEQQVADAMMPLPTVQELCGMPDNVDDMAAGPMGSVLWGGICWC